MANHQMDKAVSPATRLTESIESSTALDGIVSKMGPAAENLVSSPGRARLLRSGIFGHALHPVLTDLPVGSWVSAAVLDWTGGPQTRAASRHLVGFGNLTALPTAMTGLAEYAGLDARAQRVASLHAVANYVALGLNTWSWLARRKEQHNLGRALSVAALGAGGFGAFLGGHLAIGKKVGSHDAAIPQAAASPRDGE